MAWKTFCKRLNEGGLGILSLKAYNSATNMQLSWKFLNGSQQWSKLLSGRVKRNCSLIKYSIKYSLWSGIREAYYIMLENCVWIIGNGRIGDWWENHAWHINQNIQLAFPNLLPTIADISLPDLEVADELVWKGSANGCLSFKQAYNLILKPSPLGTWSSFPWDKDSPPAHSMIVWIYLHHKIPTDENLTLHGFAFPSICSLCLASAETYDHLFFDCQFAKNIWIWLANNLQLNYSINSFLDCNKILAESWSHQAKAVIIACIVGTFYQIWKARNKFRFEDKKTL
ncbi:unnamed protein product [Vicia faba]|uniref:Reverse transcriptase zinc-binding domain-containing protein n=1 Tax=Vicia faba TaxID=3906 RepID=A0AAV0YT84_VICFA|nr:unnamed protein product [Vicia faba]